MNADLGMSLRIVLIEFPFDGIVHDVFANRIQVAFIADDVFVIVALPQWDTLHVSQFVNSTRRKSLEGADNL